MIKLNKNEKLVQMGTAELRAPNGTLLPAVPQYMILQISDTDLTNAVDIGKNERILHGGLVCTDRKRAEERFAALKAGREPPPKEATTPLYFVEEAAKINKETGRTLEGDRIIATMVREFFEVFDLHRPQEEGSEVKENDVLHDT